MTTAQPVLLGTTEDLVILPLSQGSQHQLFASAVDNVGNRQPIGMGTPENAIVIDIPIVQVQCPNNCSLKGNCTALGVCLCQSGYYGNDCSLGNLRLLLSQ